MADREHLERTCCRCRFSNLLVVVSDFIIDSCHRRRAFRQKNRKLWLERKKNTSHHKATIATATATITTATETLAMQIAC